MQKKKCVTGCSTRTYREDVLLLLNCIAEGMCNIPEISPPCPSDYFTGTEPGEQPVEET